jgi:hypothetical protein
VAQNRHAKTGRDAITTFIRVPEIYPGVGRDAGCTSGAPAVSGDLIPLPRLLVIASEDIGLA